MRPSDQHPFALSLSKRAWRDVSPIVVRQAHHERNLGLRLAGYAALFGVPDADRDTILPGAFAATLAERPGRLPLYWQHRESQRIGWVETAREDARGLRVIARLDPGTRPAELLAARAVSGLSFGYRAREFRLTPQGRELAALDLFEISLVTHPLQYRARVHWSLDPSAASGRLFCA